MLHLIVESTHYQKQGILFEVLTFCYFWVKPKLDKIFFCRTANHTNSPPWLRRGEGWFVINWQPHLGYFFIYGIDITKKVFSLLFFMFISLWRQRNEPKKTLPNDASAHLVAML